MTSPAGPETVDLETQEPPEPPAPPELDKIMIDGEAVPEDLRGKTVAEIVARTKALSDSLRLSEQARKQAELTAETALRHPAAPPPPPPPAPKELTEEELAELHQSDPIKAIRVMQDQAIRIAEQNLEHRLRPLFSGTASSVESAARVKYADEFQLFGDQISQVVAQVTDKSAFSRPEAWDDLISLVRGRPGNLERIIEHRNGAAAAQQQAEAARRAQADGIGFSGTEARMSRVPTSAAALDPTQREIADKLGLTPEEYVKWSKI